MRLFEIPWLRTLLLYIVLVSIFVLYGQTTFYHDPNGIFFDETRAFERVYSKHREHELQQFIEAASTNSLSSPVRHAKATPHFCASFASVKRQGEQYLPLSVASTLQGLSVCEREDFYLDVFLAHTNISEHPSFDTQWLNSLVDNVHGYDVPDEQIQELRKLEEQKDYSTKGMLDYSYALESCYRTNAPYIAVMEDDIMLGDGWLIHTLQALGHIVKSYETSSNTEDDWLFLRLFNQDRSIGWAGQHIGDNHELAISLAVSIPVFLILLALRRVKPACRRYFDNGSVAIICMLAIPTFVVLFYQAGKTSMLPPRAGVRKERFGCCSQALIFPRHQVPRIQTFLEEQKAGQVDLMLDYLSNRDKLDRWTLYPVQLQHIGIQSARNTTSHEAQAIWSMAFEQQSPRKLHKVHDQLLDVVYDRECRIDSLPYTG